MALLPADRTRLVRCLGLLSSPHQGERDAAGLAANRIIAARNLCWDDVLAGGVAVPPHQPEPPPAGSRSFAEDARACLRRPELWSPWEATFLGSIVGRRRLSARQLEILAGLVERLRAQGGYRP